MRVFRGDGSLHAARAAAGKRVIRAPHHTSSRAAIIGRLYEDRQQRLTYVPGEVGLAQGGVLILHDLPEFPREVIEALGVVVQDDAVTLLWHPVFLRIPVRFEILATAADCPCGFLYASPKACTCTEEQRQRFEARLQRFKEMLTP